MADPEAPHPLTAVVLQSELGLYVSHLFQKLGSNSSVKLTLEIEEALEKWMGTFPAALRDHRPDTRWDKKYTNIPFMRCQLNIIAYCYLLAPLKPYLLSTADPEIMNTQLGKDLRTKGVDTCLDLMNASEKFYDLIYPTSIKYFFIIFFMFDAATVMCSAIVHDTDYTLPKRGQCIRTLRTAQELMDGMAPISEAARISAQLLRRLTATLPLTASEKQVLGVGLPSSNKKARIDSNASSASSAAATAGTGAVAGGANKGSSPPLEGRYDWSAHRTYVGGPIPESSSANAKTATVNDIPYDMQEQQQQPPSYAVATVGQQQQPSFYNHHPSSTMPMSMPTAPVPMQWPVMPPTNNYGPITTTQPPVPMMGGGGVGVFVPQSYPVSMQPGDPLTGTFLEPLWNWEHLNMDFSAYNMPHNQYGH